MITFYFNNKPINNFNVIWTNRILFEKLQKKEYEKDIHLFIIRPDENPFEIINLTLIKNDNKIILWYLDTISIDILQDYKQIEMLVEMGEEVLVIFPDDVLDKKIPFNFINTYSMADCILEQQNLMNNTIQFLFWNSKFLYRQKHFLSLNGTPKPHRVDLLSYITKNNFLEKFDISFNSTFWDDRLDSINLDLKETTPYTSTKLNLPLYFNSYIDIVSMAKFKESGVYLDEKIYKSLVCMKPFIVLGQYKTLDVLKEYGFQTFSDIIDESYDNEKDYVKRFEMISSELNRISLLSINEVDKLYWKVEGVLIHNSNHLRKYINKINIKLLGSI